MSAEGWRVLRGDKPPGRKVGKVAESPTVEPDLETEARPVGALWVKHHHIHHVDGVVVVIRWKVHVNTPAVSPRFEQGGWTFRLRLDGDWLHLECLDTFGSMDVCHMTVRAAFVSAVRVTPQHDVWMKRGVTEVRLHLPKRDPVASDEEPCVLEIGMKVYHAEQHQESIHRALTAVAQKRFPVVGILNAGSTCYINALMQVLYHLSVFRHHILHQRIQEDSTSLPASLQDLFSRMSHSTDPVCAESIGRMLPWTKDKNTEHDVQEFMVRLLEALEGSIEGTIVADLFEGSLESTIRCLNVPYTSSKKQSFRGLHLALEDCSTLEESLAKEFATTTLKGANQYLTGSHGMQDAERTVRLSHTPTVLTIQLKRFEYIKKARKLTKISHRLEFPLVLDLAHHTTTPDVPAVYRLYAVLAHHRGVPAGHYTAYVSPQDGSSWFHFNDSVVEEVSFGNVCLHTFGARTSSQEGLTEDFWIPESSVAYVLVYVKKASWDKVVAYTPDPAPSVTGPRDSGDITFRVCTQEDIAQSSFEEHLDLYRFMDKHLPRSFPANLETEWKDVQSSIADLTGIPVGRQRCWQFQRRENNTYRPQRLVTSHGGRKDCMALFQNMTNVDLFVQDADQPSVPKGHILLHLRWYNREQGGVCYLGPTLVDRSATVEAALQRSHPSMQSKALYYEMVHRDLVLPISNTATFASAELGSGDLVVIEDIHGSPAFAKYLSTIQGKVKVRFVPRGPPHPVVSLTLYKTMTYTDVCLALARQIPEIEADKLQLHAHPEGKTWHIFSTKELSRVNPAVGQLGYMLRVAGQEELHYHPLTMRLANYERLVAVNIDWRDQRTLQIESTIQLLIDPDADAAEVVTLALARLQRTPRHSCETFLACGNAQSVIHSFPVNSFILARHLSSMKHVQVVEIGNKERAVDFVRLSPGARDPLLLHSTPFVAGCSTSSTLLDVRKTLSDRFQERELLFHPACLLLIDAASDGLLYQCSLSDDDMLLTSINTAMALFFREYPACQALVGFQCPPPPDAKCDAIQNLSRSPSLAPVPARSWSVLS